MGEAFNFFIGVIIILLITFGALVTFTRMGNIEKEPESQNVTIDIGKEIDSFSQARGFHWTHMPLTYWINSSCGEFEKGRIKDAFAEIDNQLSNKVSFQETTSNPDIEINCNFRAWCYSHETKFVCPHETSSFKLTKADPNMIARAQIVFTGLEGFSEEGKGIISGFSLNECGPMNREIHAILEIFGYEANNNENSIMSNFEEFYPGSDHFEEGECNSTKNIDPSILNDLSSTYRIN